MEYEHLVTGQDEFKVFMLKISSNDTSFSPFTLIFSTRLFVFVFALMFVLVPVLFCFGFVSVFVIGTSVRRSSRSAFGRSTGNDVSGHYKRHYFGTNVRRSSRSAFGRSTGNDVSGYYKRHFFSIFPFLCLGAPI